MKNLTLLVFFIISFCNANELDSVFWDKEFYMFYPEYKCAIVKVKTIKKDRIIRVDFIMEIIDYNVKKIKSLDDGSYEIELDNKLDYYEKFFMKFKDNKVNFITRRYYGRYVDDDWGWLDIGNYNNYVICNRSVLFDDDVGDFE